jgi:hypothetical protein
MQGENSSLREGLARQGRKHTLGGMQCRAKKPSLGGVYAIQGRQTSPGGGGGGGFVNEFTLGGGIKLDPRLTDKKYKPCALISTSMILKMFFIILTFTRPLTFKKMFVK